MRACLCRVLPRAPGFVGAEVGTAPGDAPTFPQSRLNWWLVAGIVAGLAILVAALAADRPTYVPLALAPYAGWLVWRHAPARLTLVVVGGLFIFESNTNHLTATKVVFFAAVALAVVSILCQRALYRDLRHASTIRALLPMTLALAAAVVVSFPVARTQHTGLSPWLRDATAYVLAAAVPLFLWDFDHNARPSLTRLARLLILVCGVLSGISLVVQWLGQRAIISSKILLHILPGVFLPGALALVFAVGSGRARAHRAWYAAAALAIPVALLLTGTRAAIALLICVVGALFAGHDRKRMLLATGAVAVVAAIALAALIGIGHAGHPSMLTLTHRITSIPHTLAHPTSDNSYRERAAEWHVAWKTFKGHPLLGVGPGHVFVWPFAFGGHVGTASRYGLDTPVVFLAKFGLLGLVALGVIAFALIRFLRLRRPPVLRGAQLALAWYLVLGVVHLPFDWTLEDKDFTLGLILLGTLAVPRALGATEGFDGDWTAVRSLAVTTRRRIAVWRGSDDAAATSRRVRIALPAALLIVIGIAGASFAAGLASAPTSSTPRGILVSPPALTPAESRTAASVDTKTWAYAACSKHCRYTLTPVSVAAGLWKLHVRYTHPSHTVCDLVDTSRFRFVPRGQHWVGVSTVDCSRTHLATNVLQARANGDAAIWAYTHCGKQCRYVVNPISASEGQWQVRMSYPTGEQCFLLDTRRFAQRRRGFTGIEPATCQRRG